MVMHFIGTVCVILHHSIKIRDGRATATAIGYYRNFGLGASSMNLAKDLIERYVSDGEVDWSDSSITEINLKLFDQEIASQCHHPEEESIWYASGRSYFPPD